MNIFMAGIDFNKASIDYRERFALTKAAQAAMLKSVRGFDSVSGCVIISTCNRMELWISCAGVPEKLPYDILCTLFHVDAQEYGAYFTQRDGQDAVGHLFELACGLKSLIFGEEQILSQVKESIAFARECKVSDPVLESLFHRAVKAAKRAKTNVRLTAVNGSAAKTAVQLLKEKFGCLTGLSCLVIGSGEMGKLAAYELASEGCQVTVTLRQHHSGVALVPAGCSVIDYEERYSLIEASRAVFSATRSPHYTLTCEEVKGYIGDEEKLLFDLAVPRDIDPQIAQLPSVTLYDIDHLGGNLSREEDNESVAQVKAYIQEEIKDFERWSCVRALMPGINKISGEASRDVEERIRHSLKHAPLDDSCRHLIQEAAQSAVSKVVENILLSLQKNDDVGLVDQYITEMQKQETSISEDEEPLRLPPRFPLFVDLTGRDIAVIGAGQVALRRVKAFSSYPCRIHVTAPEALEEIKKLHSGGHIIYKEKEYDAGDLRGAFLVIAATDDRELNHQIALDAGKNGQYCSIADCKEECTFYFPATVHYEGGVIGICGTGENHARTKEMTDDIREFIKAKEQL